MITKTLLYLSEVQRARGQYELSLVYELKCFLIREKFLTPDHQDIGKSLATMGECYERLLQPKRALEYYKRALAIYEQSLSYSHHDRWNVESKVERLSAEIGDNQIDEIDI